MQVGPLGRHFEDVIVDIAFSDPLKWAPGKIAGTDLLELAGIDPIEVPILPLEQHIPERVHAYTRIYSSGCTSIRAKDLVGHPDNAVDGARCVPPSCSANRVFERRRQHPLPDRLPMPPRDWAVRYRKLSSQVSVSPDLGTGHGKAVALLDPILSGDAEGRWDPKGARWR